MTQTKDSLGRSRKPTQGGNGPKKFPEKTDGALTGGLHESEVPSTLRKLGKAFWLKTRKAMESMGTLESIDAPILDVAAHAWERLQDARALVALNGLQLAGPQGVVRNPNLVTIKEAEAMLKSCLSELGLTATARAKIGPIDEEDPFEALADKPTVSQFRRSA